MSATDDPFLDASGELVLPSHVPWADGRVVRRDDVTISCDDGLHRDCLGYAVGTTWDEWPPRPSVGRCTCDCHHEPPPRPGTPAAPKQGS